MNTTLTANETPLHKLFCDDYRFSIPAVQRPYAWGKEQAGQLLDDLIDFIEHYNITQKNILQVPEPYFLGSVVLVKGDSAEASVLDGQQRLTTLTILLSALKSVVDEDYAKEVDGMIRQKGNRMLGTEDTYRLELRKKDNGFFKKYIQEQNGIRLLTKDTETKTDSQRLIKENALYFIERLEELQEDELNTLASVIATLCYIVVVCTPNFDSAFRIFTVLNDRGLELSPSDILKAKVIGDIEESRQEEYTEKWEDIEVTIGRENFNDLLTHIRMICQKRKGAENIVKEYANILKDIDGRGFIDDILIPYGEIFINLINFKHSEWYTSCEEGVIIEFLNKIDNKDWLPVAMQYIYMNGYNNSIEFLKSLERFATIQMTLRRNFNWRQSKYSAALKELEKNKDVFEMENALSINECDIKSFMTLIDGDFYSELKDSAKRYILLRLDTYLAKGQPNYDYSTITIEHVLPQTPLENSEWKRNFDNPEVYVHRLGNLVLLTRKKNSQAKNFEFTRKKEDYFVTKNGVSTFALTTQVIQEREWTPEVVERRQEEMITLVKEIWKL